MLPIVIPAREFFDEEQNKFVYTKNLEITLEHSLISISKWESRWHKPFLDENHEKTDEEFIDYVRCMALTKVPDEAFKNLTERNKLEVNAYIHDPQTATWFADDKLPPPSTKIITNEVIYSWMIQYDIPFDPCQKWHLNHLLTLIRVCGLDNMPAKKMSPLEVMAQNKSLNKMRKAAMGIK